MPRLFSSRPFGFACGSLAVLALLWAGLGPVARSHAQGAAAPTKRALLIGINKYDHPKLTALQFAENDAREMSDVLKGLGFQVEVITGEKATKSTVEAAVKRVSDQCRKGDTLLVGFAGHGLQFLGEKDCYFVPADGKPLKERTASLVSLNGVYTELDASHAGIRVLLVDACRDDPNASRGIDADNAPRPPAGVAAMFSCKAGERAFEHKDLKHGVFFHYVLEGLKGKASDGDGEVTFGSLSGYVTKSVSRQVPTLIKGGAQQSPTIKTQYSGETVLAKVDLRPVTPPKSVGLRPSPMPSTPSPVPDGTKFVEGKTAGEERVFSDLKIKMNWCPPGTFTMGSPKTEKDRGTDEDQVEVTLSRGFWVGQTEVTQGLWESVMGTTPWKGEKYVKEVANYAATNISHTNAVEFCNKLTDQVQKTDRLARGMAFRLPTESEWEYACRAGTTTMYSFGADPSKLNEYAWWGAGITGEGNGNAKTERYAHQVGTKLANAWGIYDMHGNVFEWCIDQKGARFLDEAISNGRVIRGGGWYSSPVFCRSSARTALAPWIRSEYVGFRLALSRSE